MDYHLKLDDILLMDGAADHAKVLPFRRILFNGGEPHIQVDGLIRGASVLIEASMTDSMKLIEVLLATDALRRRGAGDVSLLMPYVPFGRQDRVCNPGEPLSIKVLANLINAQGYSKVYTLDNHSPVTAALIDNCAEIDVGEVLRHVLPADVLKTVLVAPDAGAEKKVRALAKRFGFDVVTCGKVRNVGTGEITGTAVHLDDLTGLDCYIIDDICDGGRTFVELAKELRKKGAGKVYLYVSHGIFSRGLKALVELDGVCTTNSLPLNVTGTKWWREPWASLKVIQLTKEMLL